MLIIITIALVLLARAATSFNYHPSSLPNSPYCRHFSRTNDFTVPLFVTASNTNPILSPTTSTTKRRLFIFGNGNVAKSITKCVLSDLDPMLRKQSFDSVVCTVRINNNTTEQPPLVPSNDDDKIVLRYVPFLDEEEVVKYLKASTHVVITIPPQIIDSKNNNERNYVDSVFDRYSKTLVSTNITWIGFVSTTGVYGNHDGAWVDESSDTKCLTGEKAMTYLTMEQRWKELVLNCKGKIVFVIFRCAGLYGDSFSALHTVKKKGFYAINKNDGVTSRIHLDDVGCAIVSSMTRCCGINSQSGKICKIYNLADDEPAPRLVVMGFAHKLLCDVGNNNSTVIQGFVGEERTTTVRKMSERVQRRSRDRKQVSNAKMKQELLAPNDLKFPTFREGLKSILENNSDWF